MPTPAVLTAKDDAVPDRVCKAGHPRTWDIRRLRVPARLKMLVTCRLQAMICSGQEAA